MTGITEEVTFTKPEELEKPRMHRLGHLLGRGVVYGALMFPTAMSCYYIYDGHPLKGVGFSQVIVYSAFARRSVHRSRPVPAGDAHREEVPAQLNPAEQGAPPGPSTEAIEQRPY